MVKFHTIIAACLIIGSCGGSGGNTNTGTPVTAITPPPAPAPVSMTVDKSAVDFFARQHTAEPDPDTVSVTWSDPNITEIIAQFPSASPKPDWLNATRDGTSSPVRFEFSANTTNLDAGTYKAAMELTARDTNQNPLETETINIEFTVGDFGDSKRADQNTLYHYGEEIILNGANVAWSQNSGNWYNNDIGSVDGSGQPRTNLSAFRTHFERIANAGGNSARIWLHTAATVTPAIENNGQVSGLSHNLTNDQVIAQLDSILDAAWDEGILLTFNLFSFNMLCDRNNPQPAKQMVENHFQTYIDNALTPMVLGVKDHPALFAWDVFNEPEGVSQTNYFCASSETFSTETVQRVVNSTAAAIHALDANVKVTTSTHTDLYDRFSNETLTNIPNAEPGGVLDFYSLHWYDTGWLVSPHITHSASFFADRPIVAGEFDPDGTGAGGPSARDSSRLILEKNYAGAWPWALSTGNVVSIVNAIDEASSISGPLDKAAIEACIQNKPVSCYTE